MKRELLCQWLGIPDPGNNQPWPPPPHVLLGLSVSCSDPGEVEAHVHERLTKLRNYQLSHPEEATEGMNRLAQAFVTMTDQCQKAKNGQHLQETSVRKKTSLDWEKAPPPVRAKSETKAAATTQTAIPIPPSIARTAPETKTSTVFQTGVVIDPLVELAERSPEAVRGIGSLPALIERIDQTRQLLWAWQRAGKYLSASTRKLSRLSEKSDLAKRLHEVFEASVDYPRFVAQPGLPGYRVAAMARLEMTAEMFEMLDPEQRLALARDWQAGHHVLLAHRKFLLRRFQNLRRQGLGTRAMRTLRAALNDHPAWVAFGAIGTGLVCLAAFWALWR